MVATRGCRRPCAEWRSPGKRPMQFQKDSGREGEDGERAVHEPSEPSPSAEIADAPPPSRAIPPPRRNDILAGALWTTAATAFLVAVGALGRYLIVNGLPPLEVLFLRLFAALVLLLPVLLVKGRSLVRSSGLHLYTMRCLISIVSMCLWFYALSMMQLGDLTAISFLAPIFGTIGAVLILGEVVRIRRWTAIAVALIGALVILRPTSAAFGLGMVLALLSTATAGVTSILVKQLTSHDDPLKVVFLTHLLLTPLALVPALYGWKWPDPSLIPAIIALGAVAVIGHYLLVKAFSVADASLVMMFEFSKLPWAVLYGFLLFGELTDIWTWIGATVIFAASAYIVHRETKVVKANRIRPPPKPSRPI
ncbi:MAG: DMT family transporter [Hyphomicrobiaceae bacterium]|nr:MAG: DMT family transporter [Hyphomicrobiaceae bacterium]